MKKLTMLVLLFSLLGLPALVHADGSSLGATLWNDILTNSHGHFFDNLTPGMFYDFQDHQLKSGASTEFFTYHKISADFGILRSIEEGTKPSALLGAKVKFGSLLDEIPAIHNLGANLGFDQGMLQYLTVGTWLSKNFDNGKIGYGAYGGVFIPFKA